MSVAQGYEKIPTNGLVFMYDVADSTSYKGEPTVNTVGTLNSFNPLDLYTWASSGNTSVWSRDASISSPLSGVPLKEISSGGDSYSNTYNNSVNNISTASIGQTWTVSVYALAATGTNLQIWLFEANSSGNYITLSVNSFVATGEWQRISVTRTFTDGSTAYAQARIATSTVGATIWWDGLQLEQKSHATPFVNGTRSATQALLPLVSNNTLDLSTVSFDANAQMYFDGTNDYINIPSSNVFDTQTVTVEVVVKPTTTFQLGFWFEKGIVNSQYSLFMENSNIVWRTAYGGTYDSLYFGSSNIAANAWNHVVGTYTAGNKRVYLNGTLMNSNSLNVTLNTNQGNQYIGSYNSNGYFYNGEIAIIKVYNQGLTQEEVRQSYNKYKTRFNLS